MKNLSVVLSTLAFLGVVVLFGMHFSGRKGSSSAGSVASSPAPSGKMAWVNIDTLEMHYELLKAKREDFKRRQEQAETELGNSYQQMQNDAAEIQKKAQAQSLTQSEYETAEKRLMQMQQSLETRKQSLTEKLMKEQEDLNKELKGKLDAFLEQYNKDKHYDYIFSYTTAGGSPLMYANKQLEITKDVIEGMNAASKNEGDKK